MIQDISVIKNNAIESTVKEKMNDLGKISSIFQVQHLKEKLAKMDSTSVIYYIIIILILYLISLVLSILICTSVFSMNTGIFALDFLITFFGLFIGITPQLLLLMISKTMLKNETQWTVSFILYMLVCIITAYVAGYLNRNDKKPAEYFSAINLIQANNLQFYFY